MKKKPLSRRFLLKSAWASIALPLMEAMIPFRMKAHAQSSLAPVRTIFMTFPNGVYPNSWTPNGTGSLSLPSDLQGLNPHRDRLLMIKGLWLPEDYSFVGDHAKASGMYLGNTKILKTAQGGRAGVSIDQKIADHVSGTNPQIERLLYIGNDKNTKADGNSGLSELYGNNISWRRETQPGAKLTSPRAAFDRLFSGGIIAPGASSDADPRLSLKRRSILDTVVGQIKSLNRDLASQDKQRLDQYLTSIEEVENRINRGSTISGSCEAGNRPGNRFGFYRGSKSLYRPDRDGDSM